MDFATQRFHIETAPGEWAAKNHGVTRQAAARGEFCGEAAIRRAAEFADLYDETVKLIPIFKAPAADPRLDRIEDTLGTLVSWLANELGHNSVEALLKKLKG